ncbi:MAG: hypothetical protein ACTMHL_00925 [Janibacter sp.]
MSQSLTHGNDPDRLRSISDALQREGSGLGDVGRTGATMLTVLEESWAGPDLEGYTRSWELAAQHTDTASERLVAFAKVAREQADEQERASGGGGGGGAGDFAGARGSGTAKAGFDIDLPDMPDLPDLPDMPDLPDLPDMPDLPDLPDMPDLPNMSDLPSWGDVKGAAGDVTDGIADLWKTTTNSLDEITDHANEWWKDNIEDSWLGRQAQLRLSQGAYWLGEGADWVRDNPWIPLSPSVAYIIDMGGDTLGDVSKYINDPKGAFLDDWNDSGVLGKILTLASVVPVARLLKKPADDLDDIGRKALKKDPPGWKDDFTEKAAKKDSNDPQEAAQTRLNDRANRYVERYGLKEPEDVWDTDKIDPKKRGIIVEAAQDGNLPGSYKTWDKYEVQANGDRVATSIKSMDPSLKTYGTDGAVERQLKDYVDEIDKATPNSRGGVSINPQQLDGKVLEVVTPPDGFTPSQLEELNRARTYADSKGIDIVEKEYP